MEKPFCAKCNRERLPSSSNAKFDFDYCSKCKEMTSFVAGTSAGPAKLASAAQHNAAKPKPPAE